MDGELRTASQGRTTVLPARRTLVAAARRVLWSLVRERTQALSQARSALRRRLGEFLRRSAAGRIVAILRSGALAGAVAAALSGTVPARAQEIEFPPIELADVARGEGGFIVRGEGDPESASGGTVADAGDVNGDGIPDLIVGKHCVDYFCCSTPSYVVFGKQDGAAVELSEVQAGRGGFAIRGIAERDNSGSSVSGAGDVNGDGLADVLVGAFGARPGGRYGAGESYVVFGKPGGEAVELSAIQAGQGGFAIRGSRRFDRSGWSVSGAGDVDGDGLADDLVIAARLPDAQYPSLSGAAYVVFGPTAAPPPPRFRRGAVRGEERLDISDAIRLLGYLFLGDAEPLCFDAADVDDSGRLNVTDAVRVLLYLFRGAAAPPPPGPMTCGEDPTEDELGCATATRGCSP